MPVNPILCPCDLDLDLVTLIHNLDLDIPRMYWHATNEVSSLRWPKVIEHRRGRQTQRLNTFIGCNNHRHIKKATIA